MGNGAMPTFTTEKAQNIGKGTIRKFEKHKPLDVKPYIDFEKGWKFTEDDKIFLINYYEDYLKFCNKYCGGDFAEEVTEVLNSLKEKEVEASKELIQFDAEIAASGFGYDIYKKYSDSPDTLKLIENSILDVQW